MNLFLRLFLMIFGARRRPALTPLDASVVTMHVWPNDLDIHRHMNNGRYLTLMDLGRVDLMVRTGFFREGRKRGWFPVVATATIDYRRPLKLFQRFELSTRLTGWDDRWFTIEQQFVHNGKVVARADLKAMMRSAKGLVTPQEALAVIGYDADRKTGIGAPADA